MKKTLTGMCALWLALIFVICQIQAQTASSQSGEASATHSRSKHKKGSSDEAAAQGQVDVNSASKEELEALLGRKVDLVELSAVRNPYLRASIEQSRENVYAA